MSEMCTGSRAFLARLASVVKQLAHGAWWSHGRHRHGQRRVATGGLPVGGDRLPLGVGRRPLRVCGERRLCLLTTATDHGHTLY